MYGTAITAAPENQEPYPLPLAVKLQSPVIAKIEADPLKPSLIQ